MLVGRESLSRLIGKRRRNLPRDLLIPLNSPSKQNDSGSSRSNDESSQNVPNGWVECPVCGRPMRGTDDTVNSHLDLCLARGTKRKSTQKTLLDYCTMTPKVKKCESQDDCLLVESGSSKGWGGEKCIPKNEGMRFGTLEEIADRTFDASAEGDVSTLSSALLNPVNKETEVHVDDLLSLTMLETVIVGRRYHGKHELGQGDSISVLRDHENTKDQHALKVICSESENQAIVGYLPKELAKYLSPLISRCNLKLEGYVSSSQKNHHDSVPVQIFSQGMTLPEDIDPDEVKHIKHLWANVLDVVELAKTFSPNTTRYQQNFNFMLQEVLNRNGHLFLENEKSFLENFQSLSDDSQRVFIRLYTRKGPWFRISNISYAEVQDAKKAIKDLQLAGYVCPFLFTGEYCENDISEVLNLLSVFELREISKVAQLKKPKSSTCSKKLELINRLLAAYGDGTCPLLANQIMEKIETCIRISSVADLLLWRIQRLFFLNGEQDLSAFLLVDMGLVKYPSYTCNVSRPIFEDRNDLLAYEEAIAVAQIMDESIEENNEEIIMRCIYLSDGRIPCVSESSTTFLSCFTSSWVYSKVVTLGISFCEHERRYEDAVRLLRGLLKRVKCGGKRGYWTLRLSIDLEHMGCINESLLVAEEGILDPWVRAGSMHALQRRVIRLGKPPRRWKVPIFSESISRKINEVNIMGRSLNCEIGAKNRYYGYDGIQCSVEQLALQYYAGEGGGWKGVHSENGIWMTIFGLLMWDIIFWDISDVFQTKFQTAPLDLGTDSFYLARKEIIESHLRKIQDGMAEEMLITSWELHKGTTCKGVNWDNHCLTELRAIIGCTGGHCLASICRHLAQDYRSWSSGMPDLLLWRFSGEDSVVGEVKLVEVKGLRDRLSEQQRAWLLILMDCGFNVEVCRVSTKP